jgi:hypothetical protein
MARLQSYYDPIGGVYTIEDSRYQQLRVLHNLGILNRSNRHLEPLVEAALKKCTTDIQIGNLLHGVKVGNETIEEMLTRKGYL